MRTNTGHRSASRGSGGFSLPEILVVLAIIGLTVVIGIPLVADQMKAASVRQAADQFALDVRAARTIAVTKRSSNTFTINVDPTNTYSYTERMGTLRTISMPKGVRIVSSTPAAITFNPDGSVTSAATTVLEVAVANGIERWTIATSTLGMPRSTRTRVSS